MKTGVRSIQSKQIIKLLLIATVIGSFFAIAPSVSAEGALHANSNAFRDGAGFDEQQQDPRKIVSLLVNGVLSVLGMVMVGYLMWGGYLIMTGGGVEERIKRGKRSVWTSVVGAAILLSAFAMARFAIYLSDTASKPNEPTFNIEGVEIDLGAQPDANVPSDPLFDEEFRESAWQPGGGCFGPLCE